MTKNLTLKMTSAQVVETSVTTVLFKTSLTQMITLDELLILREDKLKTKLMRTVYKTYQRFINVII